MILIVCGVSGSGKTTIGKLLACSLHLPFFDADDFHPIENIEKMGSGLPLNDDDREPWLQSLRRLIDSHRDQERAMVLACSALKQIHRDKLGVDQKKVVSIFLEGEFEAIATRLKVRQHDFMPESLLESQFEVLEPPQGGIRSNVVDSPRDVVSAICRELGSFQTLI